MTILIKKMITDYVKDVLRPGEEGDITVQDVMIAGSYVFLTICIEQCPQSTQGTQIELLDLLAWVYSQRGDDNGTS